MTNNKCKIWTTAVVSILLILLYLLIFSFSAQDGEESGSLSQVISEKCVEIINNLSGRHWSDAVRSSLAEYFEHPIRKLAHFSEYACMGILVYVLWAQWTEKGKALYVLTIVWVLLSAAADEFHQLFVPGRYGSIADVLLDTVGGAFGMLLCVWSLKWYSRIQRRKCRSV